MTTSLIALVLHTISASASALYRLNFPSCIGARCELPLLMGEVRRLNTDEEAFATREACYRPEKLT